MRKHRYNIVVTDSGREVQVQLVRFDEVAGVLIPVGVPLRLDAFFGTDEDRREVLRDALVLLIEAL